MDIAETFNLYRNATAVEIESLRYQCAVLTARNHQLERQITALETTETTKDNANAEPSRPGSDRTEDRNRQRSA